MNNRISQDGRGLEKLVSLIYDTIKENPFAEVIHDQKIENSYGGKSQFDVIIKVKVASFDLLIAIECKDYKNPVSVAEIHDFKGRCEFVFGISRKIFVAVNGYQSGAKSVAQSYGIELYDLKEITPELLSGWIVPKLIRLSRPVETKIGNIIFCKKNGQKVTMPKEEIDKNFFLYMPYERPLQLIAVCNDVLSTASKQTEIFKSIGSYIDQEWNKLNFAEGGNNAIITAGVHFNMSGKPFGAIIDGSLQELEEVGINIDYVFEFLSPSEVVTRSYKNNDNIIAEIVSGTFTKGGIDFQMIHDVKNNITKVYAYDPSRGLIEFRDD